MSRVRDPAELACREIVELFTEYQCGALDAGDRGRFEQHLFACSWCMAYLKQMRSTIALTAELKGTDDVERQLRELFRAAAVEKKRGE